MRPTDAIALHCKGEVKREITYAQALVEAAREEMLRDPKVFIMGEDVGLYAAPMELRVTCTRNLASGA